MKYIQIWYISSMVEWLYMHLLYSIVEKKKYLLKLLKQPFLIVNTI